MAEPINLKAGGELLFKLARGMTGEQVAAAKSKYLNEGLIKVFRDGELLRTCFCLFENNLNVSLTARKLYMHRNTLIYRLAKIKRLTGLDACALDDATTFIILNVCCAQGAGENNNGK